MTLRSMPKVFAAAVLWSVPVWPMPMRPGFKL